MKKKCLVIDDENVICDLLKDVLTFHNYDIVSYSSFKSSDDIIRIIKENHFDFFIVDYMLGIDLDGIELIRRIKRIPEYKKSLFILLTAMGVYGDISRVILKENIQYIKKPFIMSDFVKTIRELIVKNEEENEDKSSSF